MAATIDRDSIWTNSSMFSGHLPFKYLIKIIPGDWQHTELCLDIYTFVVSKQVALLYKCVIWGKPHRYTFCFHRTIQHVSWLLQKYLEFSLKNIEKTGNFGLRKYVGTMKTLKTWNFVIYFSRPGKCLEFAQKVKQAGILIQNMEKTWNLYILCLKIHFSRYHLQKFHVTR